MTRILVLYNQPADAEAFDRCCRKLQTAPYLIAELEFDSAADAQAALSSSEGQAASADLANFAQAGATVLTFDTRSV
jgi:uncharacterized protein (TIGR02118 family)